MQGKDKRRLSHLSYGGRNICLVPVRGDRARDVGVAGRCDSSRSSVDRERICRQSGSIPFDELYDKVAACFIKVDISLRCDIEIVSGCLVYACMGRTCCPISDSPGAVGSCRHNHGLGCKSGRGDSSCSDSVGSSEIGAVLVFPDTCLDNTFGCFLDSDSTCEIDLGHTCLDHSVVVLYVDPRFREKRGVDFPCGLVKKSLDHLEIGPWEKKIFTALQLYIFVCHLKFLMEFGKCPML